MKPSTSTPIIAFLITSSTYRKGHYQIILNSDDGHFGGQQGVASDICYLTDDKSFLRLYVTNRTVIVPIKMD